MPGEIVYSDVGTISGSTLTMDYFDVIKLKTAYVVSKDAGVVLTNDEAKALITTLNKNTIKKEIKILTPKQQQQVRDMIAKVDRSRLQIIVDRINLKIEQIQAKKTKFISDTKNITILEDVKTLIQEALYN